MNNKMWPKGPQILTRRLNEIASNLEDEGIKIETGGHDGKRRIIKISKTTVNTVSNVKNTELLNIKEDNTIDNNTTKEKDVVLKPNDSLTVLTLHNNRDEDTVNEQKQSLESLKEEIIGDNNTTNSIFDINKEDFDNGLDE